jgi:predicted O-methyltransferase YrrM
MLLIFNRALRAVVPERYWQYRQLSQGYYDYFARRVALDKYGGPFNGQVGRREIFDAIMRLQKPTLIVETGTSVGSSTEALAATGTQVISIEHYRRAAGFAQARLRRHRNVSIRIGDSRAVMKEALDKQKPDRLFAYLDAHWDADLPLNDELDIVFNCSPEAIVMIDDFHVSDDAGYGYDDYGPGAALKADYLSASLQTYGLVSLYPTLPSSKESGAKRGCVVLASDRHWKEALLSTGVLRQIR